MGMIETLTSFLEAWCSRQIPGVELSTSFVMDDGYMVWTLEDVLAAHKTYGTHVDVVIQSTVESVGASQVAMMFDATDTITGLRHRCAWFAWFEGPRLFKIKSVASQGIAP